MIAFLLARFRKTAPAPPTGRVCIHCHKGIGKHDRWHILAAQHEDCDHPQGVPCPEPLRTHLEEGTL